MRSKVDPSTVASAIGEIAGLLASGESVTISIFKNGPEAEFAEVDGEERRAEGSDKPAASVDAHFEQFEIRPAKYNFGDMLMLRTSVEAWQAQQRNEERDAMPISGGARFAELTPPIEAGRCIGISTFCNGGMPSYLIRYRAGDGRQVEEWHNEAAVVAHPGLPWASADFS